MANERTGVISQFSVDGGGAAAQRGGVAAGAGGIAAGGNVTIERLLIAESSLGHYFEDRLGLLKQFLLVDGLGNSVEPQSRGSIKELREALKKLGDLETPQNIAVSGTLFPAALLTAGWWERKKSESKLAIKWQNPLQEWLFRGFDLWAPSWDISWDLQGHQDGINPYCIAQLTQGDEADSLPVIISAEKAKKLREDFRDPKGWGGFEVEVCGWLGHRHQLEKEKMPEGIMGEPQDYYICVEDNNPKHGISRFGEGKTEYYSGYLWKCLAPKEWLKEPVSLDQVYFLWEHTNFVEEDARKYNIDGLLHKEGLIAKRHPGSELVLLQKSHAIVPGEPDPDWDAQRFYDLLLPKDKKITKRY